MVPCQEAGKLDRGQEHTYRMVHGGWTRICSSGRGGVRETQRGHSY